MPEPRQSAAVLVKPEFDMEEHQPMTRPNLQQTVLRFERVPASRWTSWVPSPEAVEAMQRLTAMIHFLRSPDSGWDPSLPQTTATLSPYIYEEATDLLDALEKSLDQNWTATGAMPFTPAVANAHAASEASQPQFFRLADLVPQVLWQVARITPLAMQLLEGTTAKVRWSDDSEQQGILRLSVAMRYTPAVAFLDADRHYALHLPKHNLTWDFVTAQAPKLLPTDAQIVALGNYKQPQPIQIDSFLNAFTAQLQQSPVGFPWFWQTLSSDVLVPGDDWQAGTVVLQLGLEFVPDAGAGTATETEGMTVQDSQTNPNPLATPDLMPRLRFTQSDWVAQYQQLEQKTWAEQLLPQWNAVWAIAQAPEPLDGDQAIALLVEDGWQTAIAFPEFVNLFSADEKLPEIAFDRLVAQLAWLISRADYEIMQFLGGVPCQMLTPTAGWQQGILRLRPVLSFQTGSNAETPETATKEALESADAADWRFDVLRQQPLAVSQTGLDGQVVVQLGALATAGVEHIASQHQPILLEHLISKIQQQLVQIDLLIPNWFQGSAVDLIVDSVEDMTGHIQLQLEFEFLAQ